MSDSRILSCFTKHQQHFLVSVTIHKARNLSVLNADTYVVIYFNDDSKKTSTHPKSDCPYFNEVCKNLVSPSFYYNNTPNLSSTLCLKLIATWKI